MSRGHEAPVIRSVHLTAPSRLHWGLFSFGDPTGRQFGGVGAMLARPEVRLSVSPAAAFETVGPLADRAAEAARRWASFYGRDSEPACRIEILAVPRLHAGLGVGTQLSLSVAAALHAACGQPLPLPAELAVSVGRGRRSAVGTYGFFHGGLIVERGRLPEEPFSPLDTRLAIPDAWRFVVLLPQTGTGLAGAAEQQVFDRLPPVPAEVTEDLVAEVRRHLLPAAAAGRFDEFASSVYRYGRLAGSCYAACQGGPYNGPRLSALVELVRSLGVAGVGQSSWGPALYAITASEGEAQTLVSRLRRSLPPEEVDVLVTPPSNTGAVLTRLAAAAN